MVNFPSQLDDDESLYHVVDQAKTVLTSGTDSVATTLEVASTAGFPGSGIFHLGSEVVFYNQLDSTHFINVNRGVQGTSATSHTAGSLVELRVFADHHNVLKDAVIEMQSFIGTNRVTVSGNHLVTTERTVFADASSGPILVTIPVASGTTRFITIIKKDNIANDVVVSGSGSSTINGASTVTLTNQYDYVTVTNDGEDLWVDVS